tara:strand:+ start:178 stop:615 length:438 start_codon:yes stop_codon:yes gene_type:complete
MKGKVCIIGITLLFASIYMNLQRNNDHFMRFYNLLDAGQKNKYESIVKERLILYITGSFLGILSAYIYYCKYKDHKYINCELLTILFLTKLSFYYFMPKQPLMLYSLRSKEQTDAWADIYTEMKNRYKYSLFVGFISYMILIYSL